MFFCFFSTAFWSPDCIHWIPKTDFSIQELLWHFVWMKNVCRVFGLNKNTLLNIIHTAGLWIYPLIIESTRLCGELVNVWMSWAEPVCIPSVGWNTRNPYSKASLRIRAALKRSFEYKIYQDKVRPEPTWEIFLKSLESRM